MHVRRRMRIYSSRVLSRTLVDWCYLSPLPPAPALLRVVDLRFPPPPPHPSQPSIFPFRPSVRHPSHATSAPSFPCKSIVTCMLNVLLRVGVRGGLRRGGGEVVERSPPPPPAPVSELGIPRARTALLVPREGVFERLGVSFNW